MTKVELIVILAERIRNLRKKYDVTKSEEHNSYVSGYIKGLQEAGSLVKSLKED